MSFRRGWTHGVLAMVVLPVGARRARDVGWDRWRGARSRRRPTRARANFAGLLLLSCIGTWLHVFMDFLNSYGVRLLMPFSERWFYGDALYIVDPWLYLALGGAVLAGAAVAAPARHADRVAPARSASAVAARLHGG